MKKNLIWILIAAVVVIGIIMVMGGDKPAETATETETQEETESVDLSGAFSGVGSMKCEYTANGVANTVVIKDGKVKVTADADGTKGYVLFRDDKVYVWNTALAGTGFVYTSAELQNANATTGVFSKSAFEAELSKQNSNCAETTVADSEFVVPTTVKFQSIAELMKK